MIRRISEYQSGLPGLSCSRAKIIIDQSLAHLKAEMDHPTEPTSEMDIGTILHRLILDKGKDFEVVIAPDYRTKAAQQERDAIRAAGKIPVLEHKLNGYLKAATQIRQNIKDTLYREYGGMDLDAFEAEQGWEWEEEGILCRGQMDLRFEATIIDLKIWESANPEALAGKAYRMGLDIQEAAYTNAVELMENGDYEGRARMLFAIAEPEPPYAVILAELDSNMRRVGMERWAQAKRLWAEALKTGVWSAYPSTVVVEAPMWILRKHEVSVYPEAQTIGEEYNSEEWNDDKQW